MMVQTSSFIEHKDWGALYRFIVVPFTSTVAKWDWERNVSLKQTRGLKTKAYSFWSVLFYIRVVPPLKNIINKSMEQCVIAIIKNIALDAAESCKAELKGDDKLRF